MNSKFRRVMMLTGWDREMGLEGVHCTPIKLYFECFVFILGSRYTDGHYIIF